MSQNPSDKGSNQDVTDKMYSYNNGPNNEINENNDENNIQSQAIRRSIGGNEVDNNFNPKEEPKIQNNINNINTINEKEYSDNFNNFQPNQFNSRSSIIHIEANPPYYWVIFVIFIIGFK